ncbi:MAG: hypothetical protein ACOCYZ_03920 [Halococcoides sp.]
MPMESDIEAIEWHPDAEGQGRYLLSFLQSTEDVLPSLRRRTQDVLADFGIEDIDQDAYYPIEDIAAAFQNIVESIGETTMRRGGEQMGLDIPFPPSVDSPHAALDSLNDLHQEAFRIPPGSDASGSAATEPAGGYDYTKIDDTTARMAITERYPFPAAMAEGVVKGVVNRFGDSNSYVRTEEVSTEQDERAAWDVSWM